jgi:Aldehyde dehydrogenase family
MTTTAFDVISPVDETIVETVRFADRAEIDERIERADRAFGTWRRVAPGPGFWFELGPDAVESFTETKNVFIATEE